MRDFGHGAIGHNDYILIARLAEILDIAAGLKEPPKPPEPGDILLTFGKYNGKTIGEVYRIDSDYVRWLADKARDEVVRAAALELLGQPAPAPPTDAMPPGESEEDPPF